MVQAFVDAGDPLDKTWLMPQASPSPMRNSKVRNSFTRNRNSLVEQSLQSSSHFVPFDGEHEEINGTNATIGNVANTVIDPDEQLLTSFTNKVAPSLAAVREESSSPTASDSNKTPKVVKTVVEPAPTPEPMLAPATDTLAEPATRVDPVGSDATPIAEAKPE